VEIYSAGVSPSRDWWGRTFELLQKHAVLPKVYNRRMNQAEFTKAIAGLPLEKAAFFPTVGSTNDVVAEWARQGIKGPALAAADEQTHGRGRAGRRWLTPASSALAFSLLLDPDIGPDTAQLGRASGLGALATCEALEDLYSLVPQIKWPNDVLLNGKKVAGILVEAHWVNNRLQALILGIGINIATESVPPVEAVNFPAISIEEVRGKPVQRSQLLRSVLEHLTQLKARLDSPEFIPAWERRLAYLGQTVRLETGTSVVEAQLHSLATDGSLRLRLPSGELRVFQMGAIQLRPVVDSQLK